VLDCRSGDRLARLVGVTLQELLERCTTVNAYATGDETRAYARSQVRDLLQDDWNTVMIVGVDTCRLAGYEAPYTPSRPGELVYGLPHTSGLSRWWNDLANRDLGESIARSWWRCVVTR
jgi:hypothetical protein